MPLVVVYHKTGLSGETLGRLARTLPAFVVDALHVAEDVQSYLTEVEVEVRAQALGPDVVSGTDLEVEVWADECPDRKASLRVRTDLISTAVRDFLVSRGDDLSVCVRILLTPWVNSEEKS